MANAEQLEHYAQHIQNPEYIPEDWTEEADAQKVGTFDVTQYNINKSDGTYMEMGLFSNSFANAVYQQISATPALLHRASSKAAAWPTSLNDIYVGPVYNVSALSAFPITDAENNRVYWVDTTTNTSNTAEASRSPLVTFVTYKNKSGNPSIKVCTYSATLNPLGWFDLLAGSDVSQDATATGGGATLHRRGNIMTINITEGAAIATDVASTGWATVEGSKYFKATEASATDWSSFIHDGETVRIPLAQLSGVSEGWNVYATIGNDGENISVEFGGSVLGLAAGDTVFVTGSATLAK